MAYWQGNYEAEEGDEDEEGDYSSLQSTDRDGLIFLIDCNNDMFVKPGKEEISPFAQCLKCAKIVLQNKIISSDRDLVAIVFFRTKQVTSEDMKNVYVFQKLEQPGAERILELEKVGNISQIEFDKKYGISDTVSLYDALWTCQTLFALSNQNIGHKRIFLFTNDDDPHRDSPHLRRQTETKAKDLVETNIQLELFDICKSGSAFDINKFYQDLLFVDEEEFSHRSSTAQRFEELLSRVRVKDYKKRARSRMDLELGPGLNLGVGVYNLIHRCMPAAPVRLERATNEEVRTQTRYFLAETGEILLPQDLKKAVTFAEKKATFEVEEVKQMRGLAPLGLKLLGFKPFSCLKRHHHSRPAQFLYADERTVEGSTTLFTALLARCLDRKVFPLCRYVGQRNTPPSFVALLPQAEELDEDGAQLVPPGFHIIFLPFADDFRKLQLHELQKATTAQIEKAKALVNALNIKYDPENIENPQLQKHYANLEALALDRDAPEEVEDHTMPNAEAIKKRAGSKAMDFKDAVGLKTALKPKKRGGDDSGAPAAKRINLEEHARDGTLGKLTVPLLKDAIKHTKITCTATKKADLIETIQKHYGVDA